MGRIAAPFGIKGWVKVQTFSDDPGALLEFDSWRIGRDEQQRDYVVTESQDHSNTLVAKLQGVNDRDQAFALRGLEVSVPREALQAPAEGEFYWADLIGLVAVNQQGIELGRVDSLMETGAHDVLVVKGSKEHLIPFIAAFVGTVDIAAGKIEVDWGEDY
ncbi:MAG: ribosome maturation factor RimM [Thiobacillaceae bacterium]